MVSVDQAQQLLSTRVVDADGVQVGAVHEVYVDDGTGEPSWVTVATGWFGLSESFVPLGRAQINGDEIRVPFDKATIKDAPRYHGGEPLSPQDEDELYRHYAITPKIPGVSTADTDRPSEGYPIGTGGKFDTAPPGADQDGSLTRSEEQLTAATERVRTGRARLRKYVTTEQETVTVPVSHEEVRVEREPITDAHLDRGSTSVELTEDVHEIVLHAERPVVTTESVPVERVRLDPADVAGKETVTGDGRK